MSVRVTTDGEQALLDAIVEHIKARGGGTTLPNLASSIEVLFGRETLPRDTPIIFKGGQIAVWDPNSVSWLITGHSRAWGDPKKIIETFGNDWERLTVANLHATPLVGEPETESGDEEPRISHFSSSHLDIWSTCPSCGTYAERSATSWSPVTPAGLRAVFRECGIIKPGMTSPCIRMWEIVFSVRDAQDAFNKTKEKKQ